MDILLEWFFRLVTGAIITGLVLFSANTYFTYLFSCIEDIRGGQKFDGWVWLITVLASTLCIAYGTVSIKYGG